MNKRVLTKEFLLNYFEENKPNQETDFLKVVIRNTTYKNIYNFILTYINKENEMILKRKYGEAYGGKIICDDIEEEIKELRDNLITLIDKENQLKKFVPNK